MSEEWGPWIEHDGRGCPVKGRFVRVVYRDGSQDELVAWSKICIPGRPDTDPESSAWAWVVPLPWKIIRYSIRKPRALIELRDMIADLPTPAERVDA